MKTLLCLSMCLLLCMGCTEKQPTKQVDTTMQENELAPALPDNSAATILPEPTDDIEPIPEADLSVDNDTQETADISTPLSGHIICIDPGHCVTSETGSGRREAISPLSDKTKIAFGGGTSGKYMTEEQLNLSVGLKLRDKLQGLGATVIMTREVSNITITNQERSEIANGSGADVCIRIHADGVDDRSVHGVSVLVPSGNLLGTPSITEESERLGKLMVDAVSNETGAKNRGITGRSDLTGFNFSEIPTVLIEMGFMSNPDEDAMLSTDSYQDKIVSGIANSLLSWYGVEYEP